MAFCRAFTKDVSKRLRSHNGDNTRSTKSRRPFRLVYVEDFPSRVAAREREKFLKSYAGSKEKREILKIARSSNGRTAPSGGVYLGSSPSLAAV